MMDACCSLLLLSVLLIVSQLSPGPDVFFVFRTALAQGFRAGCAVGGGIVCGFFLQAVLVVLLGGWLMLQPWSPYVLYAAAVWLLYLAWRIFPRHNVQVEQGVLETSVRERLRALFAQGFFCNILNPKCTLFICGLTVGPLEQFGEQFDWYAPALVLVASGACLVGWVLWSALLQWSPVRYFYLRHTTAIDAVFAILLAVFAVKLLLPC
jgi:threonine/homoserine/homoserine lactone efflux protein